MPEKHEILKNVWPYVKMMPSNLKHVTVIRNIFFLSGLKSHLRKTFNKVSPSQDALAKIQESEIWKMEHDFYQFAKEQFHIVKKRTFEYRSGYMIERKQQFGYEKIRPR